MVAALEPRSLRDACAVILAAAATATPPGSGGGADEPADATSEAASCVGAAVRLLVHILGAHGSRASAATWFAEPYTPWWLRRVLLDGTWAEVREHAAWGVFELVKGERGAASAARRLLLSLANDLSDSDECGAYFMLLQSLLALAFTHGRHVICQEPHFLQSFP